MAVERTNFLLIAGVLAAGGIGGWALRDRNATPAAPEPPATPPVKAGPVSVDIVAPAGSPAVAACDDTVGAAEECPSVGPSDEAICANVIYKRCGEFKIAFKPKVAQQAVACLRLLKGNERCDQVRINQCGHAALMAACQEPVPPSKGTFQPGTPTTPASLTLSQDPMAVPSPVAKICESLVKTCGGHALSPTLNDCRQTLAGASEAGRASMVECLAAHCTDRGLLGCEAVQKAPASPG